MEFRVLGPLEVFENGRRLQLGSRAQRALLALLVLHAGKVVSRDRLIDELWHADPPPAADVSLRSHISRLRSVLGASRVCRQPPGYMLVLADDELDARCCERLLAEARDALARERTAEARNRLRDALALWRGSPFADVAYEPFAQGEITRLEELRLVLLEERIEVELALGAHADVVGELEALVAENPLRERLRGQLMLALYRSGRQAEALESYRQARRVLTEELGLEPSEALRDLQKAILAQDPSLRQSSRPVSESAPAEDAGGAGPFVGRDAELGELVKSLDRALAGDGRLCLISGEPGIGKSRLIEQLARCARKRGVDVVVGRCWEAGGAPAFWPWVQALRTYVRSQDPVTIRSRLGEGAPHVAQILPELSDLFPDLDAPPPADPEAARFHVFDATGSFLVNASRERPLVVVLDDLHAADTPSLLLLQFLAGMLAASRLLVVGAYRDVDPSLREPLAASLAELSREPVTRRLTLVGLGEDDVANFISLSAGFDPPRHFAAALQQETGGNPLFVGEVVRLLVTEDALENAAAASAWHITIPEGVRAVIRRRLRHLSDQCTLILVLAAVLGREFELDALERVSGVSCDALLEILDEASRERVVTEVPGAAGRRRFAHALIRDAIYEDLTPGRRAQLERRVGEALEALYAADLEPRLAELAHHFLAAVPAGEAEKAINYAWRAGDRAKRLFAFEEAIRLYQLALTVTGNAAVRCDLLLALGEAQSRAGDTPASNTTFREAAERAISLELPEQLAHAALGYGGRISWEVSRDDETLAHLLERALAALGEDDSILRARLLARLAGGPLRDSSADAERRRSLGAQALAMARRIGEPSTLAHALAGYLEIDLSPESTRGRVELAQELIQVALGAGETERAVEGYNEHLEASIELGDLAAAHADLEAMAQLAEALRQPSQRWLVAVHRAALALLEGRFDEAEKLIAEARSHGERAQRWSSAVSHGLQLYVLRRGQGRLGEIEELARRSASDYPTYPVWRCVLANLLAELGSTDEARVELEALAIDGFSALPFDEEWDVSLCLLAETAARLGEPAHAATIYPLLLRYADRVAFGFPDISLGPISRYLGLLAETTGRYDEAARHFERALAMCQRLGARPWLVHAQEDFARVLHTRGGPGDAERARDLLAEAHAARRALSMKVNTTTARARLAASERS